MKFSKPALLLVVASVIIALTALFINPVKGLSTAASDDYTGLCESISEEYHICPELIEALIDTDPIKENTIGPLHLIEDEQKDRMTELGVTDLSDPEGNIRVGCAYLLELFEEYGDTYPALAEFTGTDESNTEYLDSILDKSYELEQEHSKIIDNWE